MLINPSLLQSFRWARYPISKDSLLNLADDVRASWDVVEALEEIPDGVYHSLEHITDEIDHLQRDYS